MSAGLRLFTRARRLAMRIGQPVTFSETTQSYDPATGQTTPVATAISGHAVRDEPNPERYLALGLTTTTAETLLFSQAIRSQSPALDSTVVWNGVAYRVRLVEQVGPDSLASQLRVVVSR